ncbi:hybrid sensor histidine kinase/response regulator [Candidatus Parabeggiatoa sp. HSG14]|uniref:hybrid sensor histidine kinase/response regulator n=1 Tax=Candidatus Parabeggiatoa sp. HSG14 TaxID=3055593 RepID=UPI0025A87979|nr:hybrid sensor histidine kinase/response regulator [Thiotrichales bacterium HSG14]
MQKILIVDDTPESIRVLMEVIREPNYEILVATNGSIGLEVAMSQKPDLILLDIMMPEMDGYEVCTNLKANSTTQNIPIIFITARDKEEDETKGFEFGAIDYITKPFNPLIVQARVKTQLKLKLAYEELEKKNIALKESAILRNNVDLILRHDLKAPLNGIINYSTVMEELKLSQQQEKILREIETLSYEMLAMINRSLDLYKMETGTYQYDPNFIDILQILKKIVAETKHYEKNKDFSVKIMLYGKPIAENNSFIIQGEQLLCYSMFANLFKNALEASPNKAHVKIFLDEDDTAIIRIHNQGAIPKEIRDKFFDKYTTARKSGGVGLGTYSAKLMAETQGGSLHFETSEKKGTTVIISLPKLKIDELKK